MQRLHRTRLIEILEDRFFRLGTHFDKVQSSVQLNISTGTAQLYPLEANQVHWDVLLFDNLHQSCCVLLHAEDHGQRRIVHQRRVRTNIILHQNGKERQNVPSDFVLLVERDRRRDT